MKTDRNASGFFIVEILIVLLIVGILAIAMLPNLSTYIQRAKFSDNIAVADSAKAAVELCAINRANGGAMNGTAPAGPFNGCTEGTNGISVAARPYGGYVDMLNVNGGIITVLSTSVFGAGGNTPYTYTLTPTATNGVVTWVNAGNCSAVGLC